jgi:hypothetical protein
MANRFWLGGTGNWDGTTSSSAHWGTASGGGTTPTTGPGVNDAAIFDGASGGGTVTVTGNISCQAITCGAFTGTLDFSANNNNVTLSSTTGFNGSGTATRTINLGNGLWTISTNGTSTPWNMGTTTGLTFNANGSTISFTGVGTAVRTFAGGGLTYSTVSFGPNTSGATGAAISGSNTFTTLTLVAPFNLTITQSTVQTVTVLNSNGSPGSVNFIDGSSPALGVIAGAGGAITMSWTAIRNMSFGGAVTVIAANSFNLGNNIFITITPPTMTRSRGWSGMA